MRRDLAALSAASGVYGFSIGSVHSLRFALHDLLKFPLLILITGAVCGLAFFLVAAAAGLGLRFLEVQRLAARLYRDSALLLAALAPANLLLAHTIVKPDRVGLGDYPFFLGLNVAFIALAGGLALCRQVQQLGARAGRRTAAAIAAAWLALALAVGGQAAWYLRPFFGVASISGAETRFFLGAAPDYRGSTNFYEAVYHLVAAPPLAPDFYLRGRGDEPATSASAAR
jgi:hypothetical protein